MADSTFLDDSVFFAGPSFHVDLSALDARHPIHYCRRLLIFRCNSPAQRDAQLAAFKAGIQVLVLRCPMLGGIVVPLPEASEDQQDWRTIVPDRGIELIVRDLRSTMDSFDELEAAHFPPLRLPYDLLMPIPRDLDNDRPFAACKMQFSAINGGTILTLAMSHSVADGTGIDVLMRVLCEETRFAQEPTSKGVGKEDRGTVVTTGLGEDRSVIRNMTSEVAFNIGHHPAYCLKTTSNPAAEASAGPHPFTATSPESPVLLRISAANLAQLKADATTEGAPMISTHDALSALIWRTVLLIRSRRSSSAQDLSTPIVGNIFMPSNARRHMNISPSYIGNVVYQLTAELTLDALFSPSGLQQAASAIRSAITSVDPAHVSSYFAKSNEEWVDWKFMTTFSTTGVAMGTNWSTGSLYKEDWGDAFGPMVRYRFPGMVGAVLNCIMPKLPDGGAEVVIGVVPDEMKLLKGIEGFGKYAEAQ